MNNMHVYSRQNKDKPQLCFSWQHNLEQDFRTVSGCEEWLDFHDVKRLVTEADVRKTLLEVAHGDTVQDPACLLNGLN